MFANTEAAYEALSPPFRGFLDGLVAVHNGEEAFGEQIRANGYGEWDGERFTELHPVEHPVVRTHPETGKRSLFVNPEFTSHIKGFSRRESDGLLELLYQHMVDQRFLVRYNWKAGDLGFWDNRATMHLVVIDYGTQHRLIRTRDDQGRTSVLTLGGVATGGPFSASKATGNTPSAAGDLLSPSCRRKLGSRAGELGTYLLCVQEDHLRCG